MHLTMMSVLSLCLGGVATSADNPATLFDGSNLDAWVFAKDAWTIDADGAMTCLMDEVKQKNGSIKVRGKGYIWTKNTYKDFELTLDYKLSESANSGVFFRTDKDNPVQGGFEVQLLDNDGFQKIKGKKDPRNLNGALYDCQPATTDPQNPIGEWNSLKIRCQGTILEIEINSVLVNKVDISKWDTPEKNPDGSPNKFKTALNKLPHTGYIGFQNHGNVVWFKDVKISTL